MPKGATEAVQSPGLCRRWCPHLNLQGAAPAVARGSDSAVGLWPLLCHECDLSLAPHSPASPLCPGPVHLCLEYPSRKGTLASWHKEGLCRCGCLPCRMVLSPGLMTPLPCPGPEPVAKLQRAPAASTCHEVSPDCHFSTPGPEQHQVRQAAPIASLWLPSPLSSL